MNIEVNTANTKSIDWEKIFSSLGNVEKTSGVDGALVLEDLAELALAADGHGVSFLVVWYCCLLYAG